MSKKSHKEDSSKEVKSISEISSDIQLNSMMEKIKELTEELEIKQKIISKLEASLSPVDPEGSLILPSNEEIIADMQIERIKDIAISRTLTLDETRQLEILTKVKRLVTGKATEIEATYSKIDKNDTSKLIEIARKKLK